MIVAFRRWKAVPISLAAMLSGNRSEAVNSLRPYSVVLALLSLPFALSAGALAEGTQSSSGTSSAARIVVDPEFLVSRDGDNPHVELHVAANPRRARNLVGAAITHTRPDGTPGTKVYATFDGGLTWLDASFPEQIEHGGGDPQVAFTPVGTALFSTLMTGPDETGRTRAFLNVYRSEDGGASWSRPADLGASYDHEMIAVDQTTGRFAGRIYLSALYGRSYQLGLFRSEDDGRSFIGPVDFFVAGGETLGANVLPMVVFSNGDLMATFHDFPLGADRAKPGPRRSHFYTVLSEDGGISFSEPKPAPDEVSPPYADDASRLAGDAAIAVEIGTRHRDRVYRVWNDARAGDFRLWITTSDDRGGSWSEPRTVDPSLPDGAQQFLPAIAINNAGVVGVSWNDTRDAEDQHAFRRYFSASVDGAATFLPPKPLATELSHPYGSGNLTFTPVTFVTPTDGGAVRMLLLSAAGRWGNGGDYASMAAAADGAFHPFWADSRTGTYQIWTAKVRVIEEDAETATTVEATSAAADDPVDVTGSVEFLSDPSRFDADTGVLELRLRLKNVSDRPLFGPITLTISKFGSGMGEDLREWLPKVLNAANGAADDGATFPLGAALGSQRTLPAGGISGPVLLRLRLADPLKVPNMHLLVTAVVDRTPR